MIALALLAAIQSQPIQLQCDGIVTADRQLAARAYVEMSGEAVRVRAPSELFATVTGRRQDFWREMTDVTMTDREISGRHSPNAVSRMTVEIDRMTGSIQINVSDFLAGGTSFVGDCQVAPSAPLF